MPQVDKEKQQKLQEKYQAILSGMLREEDNKYCADCDSKGPRWASWNLGVFLCIRCAGIHRNLGVHISRVKSVNLDQWTAEQIASMQAMGNSKARLVYEANLPENYRRSQTDSAMKLFIQSKYEMRKWMAKDWSPSNPEAIQSSDLMVEEVKTVKQEKPSIKTTQSASNIKLNLNNLNLVSNSKPETNEKTKRSAAQTETNKTPNLIDLIDFSESTANKNSATSNVQLENDLFADFNAFNLNQQAQPNSTMPSMTTNSASLMNHSASSNQISTSAHNDLLDLFT